MTNLRFWPLRQGLTSGFRPEPDIALVLIKVSAKPGQDHNADFSQFADMISFFVILNLINVL